MLAALPYRLSSVFIVVALCITGLSALGEFRVSSQMEVALAGAAVALAGLPHGAADGWLARHGGLARSLPRALCFFAGYLGLAAMVLAVWNVLPVLCLGVFLIMSVWHFGDNKVVASPVVARITSGLVILGAPAVFSQPEVAAIYADLSAPGAAGLVEAQRMLFWPACAVVVIGFLCDSCRWPKVPSLVDLIALVGLASLVSPLLYFVVFFCGVHSPRHLALVLQLAVGRRDAFFWGSVSAFTLVAALAGAGVFFWLIRSGEPLEAAGLRVIFVGLAALTLPHMLLVDGLYPWLRRRVLTSTRR